MKMGLPLTKRSVHFTYADYLSWPDDERWELIDGVAYNMCAAPNRNHQFASGELFFKLKTFLKGKPCKVYSAPFDVLLPNHTDEANEDVDTVVQPDIVVYCDKSKLTYAGARGAPDIAIEIVSPWTSKKDLNEKFRLYERHGVTEYWVLDPASRSFQAYVLEDGVLDATPPSTFRYGDPQIFVRGGSFESAILPGFIIDIESLFEED